VAEPTEAEDTKALLKCILDELKCIKVQLARQDKRNIELNKANAPLQVSNAASGLVGCKIVCTSSNTYRRTRKAAAYCLTP
jgi:hypothetical protein